MVARRRLARGPCAAIDAIPVAPPKIDDTRGRRETHNSSRLFFGAENRARYAVCDALSAGFQSLGVVERIERLCDVRLRGSHLRIEYCLDTDGFWLEPHTDIGAKLFTMLVYLSTRAGQRGLGHRYSRRQPQPRRHRALPTQRRPRLHPGSDTWHGFHRRPIEGVRRSLIVNYVKPEWRSRHELAFPDRLAGS